MVLSLTLISTFLISLRSFIGVFTLRVKEKFLKNFIVFIFKYTNNDGNKIRE